MLSPCKRSGRAAGFTLIEVIIAVALVAIMAVAIAPPLIQNINQGRVARAQSDAQVIGNALVSYYKDVGEWPYQTDDDTAADIRRLAGNYTLGGGNNGIPGGSGALPSSRNWSRTGTCETLTAFLIRNQIAGRNPLTAVSRNPHAEPGWNGPYLDRVPMDPWGNPFVINMRWAEPAIAGTGTENFDRHNVMVLSAGPNGIFETDFADDAFDEEPGGDDVGYVIRGSSMR
ncbi:MAG: type II secretion system protein GspG [Candidatus Krumholzibacteriota bacterium]|nr:type II secretion system protein GspG [Candidatus Krumholzibacteriota bacterium]